MNWTKIYEKHKNKWVALKTDEKTVIVAGKTAQTVLSQARQKGYKDPILMRVPAGKITYVG